MLLGVIPARGGSKGVPRKNIREVGGRPLIGHAIACGRACPELARLIVSTDDEEIAAVARRYGADVPFMRPAELAADTAGMAPVLKHALTAMESLTGETYTGLVLLDPTGALRTVADVRGAIRLFREQPCDLVVSAAPAHRNPYFNMVQRDAGGWVALGCRADPPIYRRQDAPVMFDLNTVVWVYSRAAVLDQVRMPPRTRLFEVPASRAVDVDTEMDLKLLEFLMREGAT